MIDLHMHTTCSDGQFSPEETMRMAHEAGVTVAAVTDHDTASGISRARAAAEQYGYRLGLAFQIRDDMLDVTGDAKTLGKEKRNCIFWDMGSSRKTRHCRRFAKGMLPTARNAAEKCWSICTGMACRLHWTMSAAAMTERLPADRILHGHWWNWATPPRCRTLLKNI